MFEKEIKFIYDFNLNKVNKLGNYITFEQLEFLDLHPAVLGYLSAEIDYLIFEDRQKLLKKSVFDYSGEKIEEYFTLISNEIKKTKKFTLEYISKLLLHAVSFNVNYLTRPKWALLKFLFNEAEHRTTLEIRQSLHYTHYYKYIQDIFLSYINAKRVISLNTEETSELLDKIDDLSKEAYLQNIITNALFSMAEFFNIGGTQKNKIPLVAVELFLEERGLDTHLSKIKEEFTGDNTTRYDVKDIQKSLNQVVFEKAEYVEPQDADSFIIEEPVQTEKKEEPKTAEKSLIEKVTGEDLTIEDNETEKEEEYSEPDAAAVENNKKNIDVDIEKSLEEEEINEVHQEPVSEEPVNDTEEDFEPEEQNYTPEQPEKDQSSRLDEILGGENQSIADEIKASLGLNNIVEEEAVDDTPPAEETIKEETEPVNEDDAEGYTSPEINLTEPAEEAKVDSELLNQEDGDKTIISDTPLRSINVADLLDNKNMNQIIEKLFDYDFELLTNILDLVVRCINKEDASVIIDKFYKKYHIDAASKSAGEFKLIIARYFEKG